MSPAAISDPNLPISLRPAVDFPPMRGSIFDDPGDEKSWHISQRFETLTQYYEGREPSWYASTIEPLRGAERVLDLGCGPGLALEALLEQGCSTVLGIDRWPAFTANSTATAPIITHDLTLPMPFLESGSFDGVLTHYALDYVSPICTRQVLREAHRLLAPGGRLAIYVAAIGLGGGDESRTFAYSPQVLRVLLEEAGFGEIVVEASANGRNSTANARRSTDSSHVNLERQLEARASIEGDTQLSVSFADGDHMVKCELTGPDQSVVFAFDLPPAKSADDSRVSACVRVLRPLDGGTEFQIWIWRGCTPVAMECAQLEFSAADMRLSCSGEVVEHLSAWSPGELRLEPPGSAYARFGDLSPGADLSDAERGAEGRQIVVESTDGVPADVGERLGPGRNRFLIRQASRVDLSTIDQEWLSGRAHGVALTAEELDGEGVHELLLWAAWRQALVYLGGSDWKSIVTVALRREAQLRGPLILVDPVLAGEDIGAPLPPGLATFAAARTQFFVLLADDTRTHSDPGDLLHLQRRLLFADHPSEDDAGVEEGNETLRYLTERTLLMRLRHAYGRSPAEVGRRPHHLDD
jgi:SAM-dependent methyltransferase